MERPQLHLEQVVVEHPPQALLGLGQTLAFDGVEAVVGVARDDPRDPQSGRVYLFQRRNNTEDNSVQWMQQETWSRERDDGTKDERFGSQIALRGSVLLVSATGNNTRVNDVEGGRVYVFEKNEAKKWEQTQVLSEPDGTVTGSFGSTIDTDGTMRIVVSSFRKVILPSNEVRMTSGVYTYLKDEDHGWKLIHTLDPPSRCDTHCNFASSIALREQTLLVSGKQGMDGEEHSRAEAYVYHWEKEGWDLEDELQVRKGVQETGQQLTLSAKGNVAAITTTSTSSGEVFSTGIIQLFKRRNDARWAEDKKLEARLPQEAGFGTALAMSERVLVVGAYKFSNNSRESGAAFVYLLNEEDHWTLPYQLEPQIPTTDQRFAASVGTEKNLILVGAPSDVFKGPNGGAVYAFCFGQCEHISDSPDGIDPEGSVTSNNPSGGNGSTLGAPAIAGIIVASSLSLFILLFLFYRKRKSARRLHDFQSQTAREDLALRIKLQGKTTFFAYDTLAQATNNFNYAELLCDGINAQVFKGTLLEGTVVAIKRLAMFGGHKDEEFYQEVDILSRIRHPNLIRLFGCCVENGERVLIYEFLEKGSLDKLLPELSWQEVEKVAIGIAKGLAYIHSVIQPTILHNHLKSSEILLDAMFEARISDFRLSCCHLDIGTNLNFHADRPIDDNLPSDGVNPSRAHCRHAVGTESDVYSYGLILLELLALPNLPEGAPVSPSSFECCLDLRISDIQQYHRTIRGGKLNSWPRNRLQTMLDIAKTCVMQEPRDRPQMLEILRRFLEEAV
mmetsp:Transcript_10488/g.64216  ORF Transcript_10488/g.64216 Transcript_10488/m.64216 type:complete len:786 (+) Transcript_10488:174-2531(+)